MDERPLFAENSNHRNSDRTFSDLEIVGIWPNVRLDPWLPISAKHVIVLNSIYQT